jgi:hypothetical protein
VRAKFLVLPFVEAEAKPMKRVLAAALVVAGTVFSSVPFGAHAFAASPAAGDAPTVSTLSGLIERELRWGMSHSQVTEIYNGTDGFFDREYAPQLTKLQPGVEMQQLEADRDSRKANFERSLIKFGTDPTGYDLGALHSEYTYKNDESLQKVFRDGKTRYFFYIRDRLWKVYDEVPLKEGGPLGTTFRDAVARLNSVLGTAGRTRTPGTAVERTEVDWQDRASHFRVVDRSGERLIALVLEDRNTLANLASLRSAKPTDPFAIDPAIAAITKDGVSDPNANTSKALGAAGKGNKK